jgi:hypothetical protein
METRIALRYTGPAVESGVMDVYEASANMIAFSEFVLLSARSTYGPDVSVRAEVAGFGRGSFVTDLVFNVGGAMASVFSTLSPKELLEVIKQSIEIWKHLKGEPPKRVETVDGGQNVQVTNNTGTVLQVRAQSLNVTLSDKGSEAVAQFVREALQRPGMDSLEVQQAGKNFRGSRKLAKITQKESGYFVPVAPSERITDATMRMALIIEGPVFKEGNKWRFSDGQQSFHAEIADQGFLQRVNSGERFGKGDVLYADVRISQEQTGMRLSAERTVVKVHDHKLAPKQLLLPAGSGDDTD